MIGKTLRTLRTSWNISQQELANILGLSQQQISFFEADTRTPDLPILNKIADYFNVTSDYLLGRVQTIKFIPSNLLLLKGEMSWNDFSNNIVNKLGDTIFETIFSPKNLERMSKGKLEPESSHLGELAIYAEVPESFFYKQNTLRDLQIAREKYQIENQNRTNIYLNYKLSDELKQFLLDDKNLKYLEYAKKLKDNGIDPDKIINFTQKI
jgi:transcriptional regulator with XRE-family HTH domain